ncbi:MAG: hypothetical protein E7588_06525 [Ruminococcaceae bacterium]|nr:hypothetical protein [Oscillospiraceae bacterium]
MKRIISLFAVLAMLFSCFALYSCADKPQNDKTNPTDLSSVNIPGVTNREDSVTKPAKTPEGLLVYKENAIPGGVFLFLLSQTKSTYLYSVTGDTKDDKTLWSTESDDGRTISQVLFDETLNSALSILYYAQIAKDSGITLSQSEDDEIITALDTLVAAYGTRTAFNNEMLRFGVGYNTLRDFYRLEALAQKGADSVLGEGGSEEITRDELMDYYKKNFITLRHIYFNTAYADPETGEELTEDDKKEKSRRADGILEIVNTTSATLKNFKDESEDGIINESPDGITIPLGDLLNVYASSGSANNVFYNYYFLFSNVRGFAEAALMHDSGVVTRVDNEGVGIFLVERTPLILNMFDKYKDAIAEFVIRPQRMNDKVEKLKGENAFKINQTALDTYNIESAPVLQQNIA